MLWKIQVLQDKNQIQGVIIKMWFWINPWSKCGYNMFFKVLERFKALLDYGK